MSIERYKPENWILRDARGKTGMTQQQVADRANIQLRQYQRFESGERELSSSSFNIARNVLQALDLDMTSFAKGEYSFTDIEHEGNTP